MNFGRLTALSAPNAMPCDGRFAVEGPMTEKYSHNLAARDCHAIRLRWMHLVFPATVFGRITYRVSASQLPNVDQLLVSPACRTSTRYEHCSARLWSSLPGTGDVNKIRPPLAIFFADMRLSK